MTLDDEKNAGAGCRYNTSLERGDQRALSALRAFLMRARLQKWTLSELWLLMMADDKELALPWCFVSTSSHLTLLWQPFALFYPLLDQHTRSVN